ncbi:arylsulfatase [Aeoliella sp. ICT_H6.2]|uniref:Arylsulfatase n=1 Tax=Aeoliella straminimaris TaxID=2954799 RepID=A0A9X2F9I1_9BACT|nr:arylsulfatase [Aeoliella straminimaris]MCO6044870.1 arylsulfatase [Aeoliella straminimaris]
MHLTKLAIVASTVLTIGLAAPVPAADRSDTPNIILIVADDLGYGELGCYGQQIIRTPRIDELAADGVRFTDFYSGSPVCAPSRCVLMTGKSPAHAYIRDNGDYKPDSALKAKYGFEFPGQQPIPAEEVTLAEVLKQCGYATAAMGKWGLGHFGTSGDPNSQGFDLFFGYNCQRHAHNHYPSFLWRNGERVEYPGNDGKSLTGETFSQDEFTREALQFIREKQDQPFFLYLPVIIPHLSIQVPESSLAEYEGKIDETPYEHHGYLKHPAPHAGYAAMVTHLDKAVGQVVDLVDELGLAEDTLIIFTSDNGPTYERLGGSDSEFFHSAGGLRGLKGSIYEGGIRVPLVARWPGHIKPDTESDAVSAFWDLMPTVCEVVGADCPQDANGVSILPAMTGDGQVADRDYLIWEFPGYGGQQAIRMGDWKGVVRNTKRGNTKLELYDLQNDPAEANNVAKQHPQRVARMKELLKSDRTESEMFPLTRRRNAKKSAE